MLKQIILVVVIGLGFVSCSGDNNASTEKTKALTSDSPTATTENKTAPTTEKNPPKPEATIDWDADELLIQELGVAGIFTGQHIGKVESRIGKALAKTAEGEFVQYNFTDSNKNPIGYFMLDKSDQTLIGDVIVTSPKAATKDGIRVGSTYADLKAVAPNLAVHGSEIESRTTAYVGRVAYLLDFASNTYEMDESKIKPNTKIKEIILLRHPQKSYKLGGL